MVSTSINFTAFQVSTTATSAAGWPRPIAASPWELNTALAAPDPRHVLISNLLSIPCFPLACLLNLICLFLSRPLSCCRFSFLCSSLLSWFIVLFFVFCSFCSDCMRFYSILFPIVLLLLGVLAACLSFTRARSHGWIIWTVPHSKLPQPSRCLMSSWSEEPHMIMKTPLQAVQQGFVPRKWSVMQCNASSA